MLRVRRARPLLESLEGRYAPATIRLVGGYLFISNNVGNLTVTATANNTFKVQDGASVVPGLTAGSGVFITTSNKAETVTFKLEDNVFSGNLLINTRNGDDVVTITDTAGGTGRIGGNVTLLTGLGDDSVSLLNVNVGGSLTAVDTFGDDSLAIYSNANATVDSIGGNVTGVNYNEIKLGHFSAADSIGGSVSLTSISDGVQVEFNANDDLTIGKNLTIQTGNQYDKLNFGGVVVGGNLTATLGGGDGDDIDLAAGINPLTVNGNLYLSSNAIATLVTNNSAGVEVGGNMTLNYGDGANIFALAAFGDVNVGGNFSLTAGNGDNATGGLLGNIAGNLSFRMGNGNNDFTVYNAPAGTLNWRSGNGTNLLYLGDQTNAIGTAGNYLVNVLFGTGDDTLTLDTTATGTLSGYIDFDGGANDTLTVVSGVLSPNLVIANLP